MFPNKGFLGICSNILFLRDAIVKWQLSNEGLKVI